MISACEMKWNVPSAPKIYHLKILLCAAAEHLDSVTQGKLFDTAAGYVAQFPFLSAA